MARLLKLLPVLLGLLLIVRLTPAAQSAPTLTALPDAVISAQSALLFPAAVVTELALAIPRDRIAALQVAWSQEGWAGDTRELALESAAVQRPQDTLAVYVWEIPADDPPRLFLPLTARWTITTTDGETLAFDLTLPFADPRARWTTARAGAVRVAVPAGRLVSAGVLSPDVESVAALLQENTGTPLESGVVVFDASLPDAPCPAAVLTPPPDFISALTGLQIPCDASAVLRLYERENFRTVNAGLMTYETAMDAISVALVREAYGPLWADADVPAWFQYGLGLFYAPTDKTVRLDAARAALRVGGLPDFNAIPSDVVGRSLWEAQSVGAVLAMAEVLGVDGLFTLASALANGPSASDGSSLDDAYAQASGEPLAALLAGLPDWLFSAQAASAFRYHPYLPATPTPTLTPSNTAVPPTITPTPTVTETPTPTATVTGVLTPTPRPITATVTPTPTVTLRPAGSFNLAPTPAPPAEDRGDSGANPALLIVGAGGGLLAVVIGAFLSIRLLRKRNATS